MKKEVVSTFVQQVIAKANSAGDISVTAEKNLRLAQAAVRSEIACQEAAIVKLETEVENAEENLSNAIYTTKIINDGNGYLNNIKTRKEALEAANDKLAATKQWIEDLKELQATHLK